MAQSYRVTVIEQCQVAPPPNSVPTTSLPLTFLDIQWLRILCIPVQRLFFYELPQSTHYFTQSILPTLKHSLSLTLQHFFPFAANLVCPPPHTHKPHILYTEGNSIPFTVAEAAGDFNHLIANYPRDVREFHHFVPHLPPPHVSSDNLTRLIALMAIQVTVFPNKGICIGISFCHAAADGRAFHHFMKSWASVCRKGGDLSCLDMSPPFHDRAVIKDTNGFEQNFLENWWNWDSASKDETDLINDIVADKVRSTFVLRRAHIEGLKQWVRGQCMNREDLEPLHISTFVVTCALIWACLIKSQHSGVSNLSDDSKLCHFTFLADCRNRLNFPIPSTYFGNCLEICFVVPLERRELVGETGIFQAVKAIGNRVRQLETEVLRGAEAWLLDWKEQPKLENLVTIAGSPSFGVYETDFGWGRPKKSEVVHIDITGIISVAESRDEDGGIEVGLALTRKNIDDFTAIWEKSLKLF